MVGLEKFDRMVAGKAKFMTHSNEIQLVRLKLPKDNEHERKLKFMSINN